VLDVVHLLAHVDELVVDRLGIARARRLRSDESNCCRAEREDEHPPECLHERPPFFAAVPRIRVDGSVAAIPSSKVSAATSSPGKVIGHADHSGEGSSRSSSRGAVPILLA
jgi:hypothetical protein